MQILILSDTHGRADLIDEVLGKARPDLILYCGDGLRDLTNLSSHIPCPLYAVKGNCDLMPPPLPCVNQPISEEILIPIEDNMKVLLTHGHTYGVKYGLNALVERAAAMGADAVIFGHTHKQVDTLLMPNDESRFPDTARTKPLHLFNPGSLGHAPHTFGILTLRHGVPLFSHGALE